MNQRTVLQALVIFFGCSNGTVVSSGGDIDAAAPLAAGAGGSSGNGFPADLVDAGRAAGGGGGQGGVKGGVAPDTGASVLERNGGPSRAGHFVQPTLTKATVAKMLLERSFMAPFAGDVWASPLYLENGPGGKGVIFAVSTSNDVHAIDEKTGAILWTTRIGNSPTANGVPCGDIHPLGILGTPVIDLGSRTIYVAGAIGQATIERHEVHALSVDDGKERSGWPIDVGKVSGGKFNAPAQNQRGALSLVNGVLYVPYGGHTGECGDYRGWVFAIDAANPSVAKGWATDGAGEGIGASGGMASDGNGVFAVTGKSAMGATSHLDSQEILRITGMASARRDDQNLYYPGTWNEMDGAGVDFGSNNPVLVEVPGATPSTFVAATSGDGHLYLLDSKKLGGIGGHVVDFKVATGTTAIRTAPTVYSTSKGTHIAITASAGVSCPVGSPAPPVGNTGQVVVSVFIPPGAPPKPEIAWCYYLIQGQGSPVSTTTDGRADAIVWFMNDVKLLGLDGDTGREVFDGTHDISGIPFAERTCPGVHPWTSPIAVKGRMIVAANGRLCSWAPP